MTKESLVKGLSEKSGVNKNDIEAVFAAYEKIVNEGIKEGEKVPLPKLGHFEKGHAAEKECYKNPRNHDEGKKVVPAHDTPKFKFSDGVKKGLK